MADSSIAALNSLLRGTGIEDHEEVLKLSTAAARALKNSNKADELVTTQRARVTALVKLDRFEEALQTLDDGGVALAQMCVLERAYALYKTGALEAAESVLREAGAGSQVIDGDDDARGLKHVSAQVAYRAERFETAAEIYRSLLEEAGGAGRYGEENDLKINLLAASAHLEWQGKGWAVPQKQKQPGREELEAFETAYNAACGCIARGDIGKAAVLLTRARDLCQALEDLSDEEKKAELIPIVVQQAYVLARLGKADEAEKLLATVSLSEIPDASTKTVANNNSAVLKLERNPYLAQRTASLAPKEIPTKDRLFEYQASALKRNHYAIELQCQKFPGVLRSASRVSAQGTVPAISPDKASLGVFRAAAQSRLQTGKEALRNILPLIEKNPDDVGLLLTVVQLYVQLSNPAPAIALLEAFFKRLESATTPDYADVRFAPGLVAVAVALYRLQRRPAAIRAELARAAAHWQQKEKSTGASAASTNAFSSDSLLRQAGIELLRSSKPEDLEKAGRAFERLVSSHPDDRTATAGLVASFASTADMDKIQPHLYSLSPVEKLIGQVDVEALLDAGVATIQAPAIAGKKRALDVAEKQQGHPPTKKKRRNKPAKNFKEGKTPDPERWLPLRDRSSYRPKGRKGKKRAAEATQGGVVRGGEEETLELAGGVGSVKVERAPQGGGGGGGKKKKKGKK